MGDVRETPPDMVPDKGLAIRAARRAWLDRDRQKTKAEKIEKLTTEQKVAQSRVILDDAA